MTSVCQFSYLNVLIWTYTPVPSVSLISYSVPPSITVSLFLKT